MGSPATAQEAWDDLRRAYRDAASWFAGLVARVDDRWDDPGLGVWTVRDLVGHTCRSLLTVEEYLDAPADAVDVPTAAEYFRATRALAAGDEVAERGRAAGRALGVDPVTAVGDLVRRVPPLLDDRTGDELVTTVSGGMRLRDYLPTRLVELAVHGLDLAAALGAEAEPPAGAARHALAVLADLAADEGRTAPLLRGLTGRTPLPAGFSVL